MGNRLLLLAAALMLAGCGGGMPDFLGREGGTGYYRIGGEVLPQPVPVAMTDATVERGLYGVLIRVTGEAPAQGYWSTLLEPLGTGEPDAAGVVSFRLMAVPPAAVGAVGPARTRQLSAGLFIPNRALRETRAVRVAGLGAPQTLPLPAAPARPPVAPSAF
jgi:hypothetical protein